MERWFLSIYPFYLRSYWPVLFYKQNFFCLYVSEVLVVDTTEYPEVPCPDSYTSVYDVCTVKLLFLCWDGNWESIFEEAFSRYEIHGCCASTCTELEDGNTVEGIWSSNPELSAVIPTDFLREQNNIGLLHFTPILQTQLFVQIINISTIHTVPAS
jgi:hypothetical protein